ncbi:MAG: glycoside hydrolase family 99-like domain-containing protein [Lachnospiraceae bacterium]|nr:glycoside hydrolase family 99-like domain-containing protein [Lachnospiraceae bacterium]
MIPKVLAIYLPQYHRIPENDEWWGEGFTEWANVRRGKPFYQGHYQPREPLNDDYYDLSDLSVLERHTKLAKRAGIEGFCFYHYYFKGKKLLEKPVEEYREHSKEQFPYCLIWANQSWTRTWYRGNIGRKVLINQDYGNKEDWEKHFNYLLHFFKDDRYIKIDGKPVYIIYLPQDIICRKQMFAFWRKLAVQNGFKGLYIIAMDTWEDNDLKVNLYDAFMNFEPAHTFKNDNSYRKKIYNWKDKKIKNIDKNTGKIIKRLLIKDMYTYSFFCKKTDRLTKETPKMKTFLGVFSGWDNTARKDEDGLIIRNCNPKGFGHMLERALKKSCERHNEFVFINAWNEWSEGAYLEPDKKYGYAYLNEIRRTVKKMKQVDIN